ncbi:MAG TPA: fatty acid desaturase [Thermoanaerobaculia bacterium]|nr:fatty acid desaturase [Thermoanaerobaculia bacterium]
MNEEIQLTPASLDAMLKPYAESQRGRSIFQLVNSFALYIAAWFLTLWLVSVSYWLALPAAFLSASLLIRLFIIFHDCGHGSFFRSRRANGVIGAIVGVMTLTPYQAWRRRHAAHHAATGNLDVEDRSLGTINTLTVNEYRALSPGRRFLYRVYRHPFVILGIGALFHFIVSQRFPQPVPMSWRHIERRSVWWTNVGIVLSVTAAVFLFGWKNFLLVQIPITCISSAMGMWLFFVQHQFDNAYWEHTPPWNYHDASLYGSSHYDLHPVLHWFTGNIGFHHVHHLNSRIPNYRLKECLDSNPPLQVAPKLRLFESLRCATLALWDEERRTLVSFRNA